MSRFEFLLRLTGSINGALDVDRRHIAAPQQSTPRATSCLPRRKKKIVGGALRQGRHHAPAKEHGQRGSVMIELPPLGSPDVLSAASWRGERTSPSAS
jgi:hypothetical protein